jgi:hypothetical protein
MKFNLSIVLIIVSFVSCNPETIELLSPALNSTDTGINTQFEWNQINGTEYYELFITDNEEYVCDFENFDRNNSNEKTRLFSNIKKSDYTLTGFVLLNNTTVHWAVRYCKNGELSRWSEPYSFKVKRTVNPPELHYLPQNVSYSNLSFSWNLIADAEKYIFQLSGIESFNDLVVNEEIEDNSFLIIPEDNYKLIPDAEYYYRVKAVNSYGDSSEWSSAGHTLIENEDYRMVADSKEFLEDRIKGINYDFNQTACIVTDNNTALYEDLESFSAEETINTGGKIEISEKPDMIFKNNFGYYQFYKVMVQDKEYYINSSDFAFLIYEDIQYSLGIMFIPDVYNNSYYQMPFLILINNENEVYKFKLCETEETLFEYIRVDKIDIQDKNFDDINEIILTGEQITEFHENGTSSVSDIEIWLNYIDGIVEIFRYKTEGCTYIESGAIETEGSFELLDTDNDGFMETVNLIETATEIYWDGKNNQEILMGIKENEISLKWNDGKYQ